MPNWTERDLQRQLNALRNAGWAPYFDAAAASYQFEPTLLIAIASRETNLRNIIGDGGHGYGVMQIDDRSYPDWCHSGAWKNVQSAILKGAQVLDGKRADLKASQGKRLSVGGQSFTGKTGLTDAELLRTAVAAYNSGLWAYYGLTTKNDPDFHTTGKDYSADVQQRQAVFQRLMAAVEAP